jgi:hypothetical protein
MPTLIFFLFSASLGVPLRRSSVFLTWNKQHPGTKPRQLEERIQRIEQIRKDFNIKRGKNPFSSVKSVLSVFQ